MANACQSVTILHEILGEAVTFASASGPIPPALAEELEALRSALGSGAVTSDVEDEIISVREAARRALSRARSAR
jgi:hypothetical protein